MPAPGMEPLMVDSGTLYAYRHAHALGIQFHPEMDRAVIERIIAEVGEDEKLVGDLERAIAAFDETSRARALSLFERSFAALLEGRTSR